MPLTPTQRHRIEAAFKPLAIGSRAVVQRGFVNFMRDEDEAAFLREAEARGYSVFKKDRWFVAMRPGAVAWLINPLTITSEPER